MLKKSNMPRSRAGSTAVKLEGEVRQGRIKVREECLEWDAATPAEASAIRTMMGRVNGACYPQPYLVEGPPGHFSLYVGTAAEQARTARGIVK